MSKFIVEPSQDKDLTIVGEKPFYYPSGDARLSHSCYQINVPWQDEKKGALAEMFVRDLYTTVLGKYSDLYSEFLNFFYNDVWRLRLWATRKVGQPISRETLEDFLNDMEKMSLDISPLLPDAEIPVTDNTMPNLSMYRAFGVEKSIRQPGLWKGPTVLTFDFSVSRAYIGLYNDLVEELSQKPRESKTTDHRFAKLQPLRATYSVFPPITMYYPILHNSPEGVISIDWVGDLSRVDGSMIPRSNRCDISFPPSATESRATLFMGGLATYDGLEVLDYYTVTDIGRVDQVVDEISKHDGADDFFEWMKSIRIVQENHESFSTKIKN